MLVKESLQDVLKPKPSQKINNKISAMSVEEKQSVLFDSGMTHFMGDFEEFFIWLEKRYPEDSNRLWDTIISTIYALELNPTDESGNDEEIDAEWVINTFDIDWLLQEIYLDSMKEENIDDALSFFIPGYKVNENFDILQAKGSDEILQDLKNLSFDEVFSIVEDQWFLNEGSWEGWQKLLFDVLRYIGKGKFKDILAELIVLKQKDQI